MPHTKRRIDEVKGPGPVIYRTYCECGHSRLFTYRLAAELDLADHVIRVMEAVLNPPAPPADNFVDTYHDEREIERRQFGEDKTMSEWRQEELRSNY